MKFEGIIEHYNFVKLSKEERELFLINNKIFVKSQNQTNNEIDNYELYNDYTYEISKIFTRNLINSNVKYILNEVLLDQIKNSIVQQCREIFQSIIENENRYRDQFYAYPQEKINKIKISTKTSNGDYLYYKPYAELTKLDYKNFDSHVRVIESFVKYDHKFIYDFLIGIDNESSYFKNMYHTYITNHIYLKLLDEIDEFNEISSGCKSSIPRRIALMNQLGMLDSSKFNNLSNPQKAKVVAYIMNIELDKDRIEYFKKNIRSLNPNSTMDPKGMASLHMHTILKEVLNS